MRAALIAGEGSLATQVAELWLRHGNTVVAVVSDNLEVVAWCRSHGVMTRPSDELEQAGEEYDVFVSAVSRRLVPASVLDAAKIAAINFHDGPLPDYAGFHAPAWALLAGERTYGVAWHLMTARPNAGDVLEQRTFPISAQDTAFSLNARCFAEGVASFESLVDRLSEGQIAPQAQDLSRRRYFAADRRPAAMGYLDFADAETVERSFRALDFGPYPNPLVAAKCDIAGVTALIKSMTVTAVGSEHSDDPATVIAVTDDRVVVRCGRGTVSLTLTDLDGRPSPTWDQPPIVGALVRVPGVAPAIASSVRHEDAWREVLSTFIPTPCPFASSGARATPPAPVVVGGSCTLLELLAFLTRLEPQDALGVGLDVAETALWADTVPLTFPPAGESSGREWMSTAAALLAMTRARGSYLRDLVARTPSLRHLTTNRGQVVCPVVVADRTPPHLAPLTVVLDGDGVRLASDGTLDRATLELLGEQLQVFLSALQQRDDAPLATLPLMSAALIERLDLLGRGPSTPYPAVSIAASFEAAAQERSATTAVRAGHESLTYSELNARANQLAHHLRDTGVRPGDTVGIHLRRGLDMVIAVLATHKASACYVPLDPAYPPARIAMMIEDAGLRAVVSTSQDAGALGPTTLAHARVIALDHDRETIARAPRSNLPIVSRGSDLAYMIYTSGYTGRPKGVLLQHRHVQSFFAAMDHALGHKSGDQPGVWLAVTSLNFDISVLELLWTLCRGFEVLIALASQAAARSTILARPVAMSLFYFASQEGRSDAPTYELLLDGARFADDNGFEAVWTPERHFHAFGGIYPNAAVVSAAIAAVTKRVAIRSGSIVSPLHHPARIAEDWAVVDNLSGGRVGLSFASGWQPNDFVLSPDHFSDRKNIMFTQIEQVQRLWQGEAVAFRGPTGEDVAVQTFPRPVQPRLPVWITAASNPETFDRAGRSGANVLTHLLGQSVDDLADKIAVYRRAWRDGGHAGEGHLTLMLHTFIGTSAVHAKQVVREPMKRYLASAVELIKRAAWSFPTFKDGQTLEAGTFSIDHLTAEERDALLEHAFERYFDDSGLFGDTVKATRFAAHLAAVGVDEIACLIDFGVPDAEVRESLPRLATVRHELVALAEARSSANPQTIAEWLHLRPVTHLQCTPSQARLLVADPEARCAMFKLRHMLVGGEALPVDVALAVCRSVGGVVHNMYGPTETTVWSTTQPLSVEQLSADTRVAIGRPIGNTVVQVQRTNGEGAMPGTKGELLIGGDAVAQGYHDRDDLTAERFVQVAGQRWYRTGDLVSMRADGTLDFHGRLDNQVKVRGHRIELGEIEACLTDHVSVTDAVVVAREDRPGDLRLVAYVTVAAGQRIDAQALRQHAGAVLPAWMVPQVVVEVEAFPLTPNLKIDRRALQPPEDYQPEARGSEPAAIEESPTESIVHAIWCEVLNRRTVGRQDNFFDLGGHSLLSVQVQLKLQQALHHGITLVDLFRFPTIRGLAQHLDAQAGRQRDVPEETAETSQARQDQVQSRREALNRLHARRRRRTPTSST